MRITYVARSFLDYRVPVLAELNNLCEGQLCYIASTKWTPERALNKLSNVLGERAVLLSGEKNIGVSNPSEANRSVCIPYQPGLLREIADTRPDVLVGDGFFQWTFAALLHRILHSTPLVVCYERWAHTERRAQWYRNLYRKAALRFTAAVCCNGSLCADYTRSLGFRPARITVGHMAADTEGLASRAIAVGTAIKEELRKSWNARGVVFLYVGQLITRKGIAQLLQAWKAFQEQQSESGTLVLVGTGPEEKCLKDQAVTNELKRVCFVGAVDYDRLAAYYAAADVLVIPTLEDNWSLVVPEAMACGLPILSSKYNGCWPELVPEYRNGWVFDPMCIADIVRALNLCIKNRERLPQMGRESKAILSDHTPRKAAEAIFEACRTAMLPRKEEDTRQAASLKLSIR
jgi:glycosyltransferase involved in cell wall biosynthesis